MARTSRSRRGVAKKPAAPKPSIGRRRPPRPVVDATSVLQRHYPSQFTTFFIPEPRLRFGRKQGAVDPKTGLAMYGPNDVDEPGRRHDVPPS